MTLTRPDDWTAALEDKQRWLTAIHALDPTALFAHCRQLDAPLRAAGQSTLADSVQEAMRENTARFTAVAATEQEAERILHEQMQMLGMIIQTRAQRQQVRQRYQPAPVDETPRFLDRRP